MQGNCPWLGWCKNKQNIPDSCECRQSCTLRCRGLGTKRLKGAPCEAYLGADDSAGQVREFCIKKTQLSRDKCEIFSI
jgi:hypothetical protein